MNKKTKRKLRDIHLGINTSGVDAMAGAAAALAGETGHALDVWLSGTFNQNFDAYDKAVDALYNTTRIGGPQYHHLVDGQHSLFGALSAVKDVSADDIFAREFVEAGEHLLRDTASISGSNILFNIKPETFDALADMVDGTGITKAYLADAFTINGSELLGGAIALGASVITAKIGSSKQLSRLSSALLVSGFAAANPLMMSVAGSAMAFSLYKSGNKKQCLVQAGKGALVSGSVLVATNIIGGPVWWTCLTAMGTAVVVGKLLDNPEAVFNKVQSLFVPAKQIIISASNTLNTGGSYA